jgi:hypothetical protein
VSILGGDYTLFDYQEKSYDGYMATDGKKHFELKTATKSTEKIGEQLIHFTTKLQNDEGDSMNIVWSQISMTLKQEAIKNCELKSFNIQTKPHPGETITSSKKMIVVNLADIAQFFDYQGTIELDEDNHLLYL